MVDSVEIKTEETTSEKPVEEKQSTQSVQGLPEKFKSVEEMAKSYSELEKKLGEQAPKQVLYLNVILPSLVSPS